MQLEAATVGYVAASVPPLATPSLADAAGDAVDGESIRFLLWGALKTPEQVEAAKQASLRRQRKAAAKKEKEMAEMDVEASSSQRRKKKRKKKQKLLRSGRTRRRHRQWRVRHTGFAGSCAPRDVFPVAYDWPLLLGNTAGMDQEDSIFVVVMAVAYARLVLLVSLVPLCSLLSWSGPDAPHHGQYPPEGLIQWAGFTGVSAPHAVFPSLLSGP